MNRFLCTLFLVPIVASSPIHAQVADQQAARETARVNRESKIVNGESRGGEREKETQKKTAATSGELFDTIARMDSAMFDVFNGHDVDRLMSMFTDDLEFYHDTGGVTNYEQSKENFGKLFTNTPDIRRDLVKGSLEVYPIKDYGAIEIGEHVFCHTENGSGASPARTDCGRFKFAMVWRKTGESWKISRVISYGH